MEPANLHLIQHHIYVNVKINFKSSFVFLRLWLRISVSLSTDWGIISFFAIILFWKLFFFFSGHWTLPYQEPEDGLQQSSDFQKINKNDIFNQIFGRKKNVEKCGWLKSPLEWWRPMSTCHQNQDESLRRASQSPSYHFRCPTCENSFKNDILDV